MNTSVIRRSALAALTVLCLSPLLGAQASGDGREAVRVPAPVRILEARPFETQKAMTFRVDGKSEPVKKGWVVVVAANLRLLQPEESADYVLFAGRAIGQRVNSGYRDGRIVVVIPEFDPLKDCIWLGSRGVPDRMELAEFEAERQRAAGAGIQPFESKAWNAAVELSRNKRGDSPLLARDLNELWFKTVPLLLEYAPAEEEMARSLRPGLEKD